METLFVFNLSEKDFTSSYACFSVNVFYAYALTSCAFFSSYRSAFQ
jgi:hypothetical protein